MARITRVQLENYKSIKFCDVRLEPLTVLVGKNGSGKSNFLDALAFTRDVQLENLEKAIRRRKHISHIVRQTLENSVDFFSITLEFEVEAESFEMYFRVSVQENPSISEQHLRKSGGEFFYKVSHGVVEIDTIELFSIDFTKHLGISTKSNLDTKSLISGLLHFLQVFQPQADTLREIQELYFYQMLQIDSTYIDSMLFLMQQKSPQQSAKMLQFLKKVNPNIETIQIEQRNSRLLVDFVKSASIHFDKADMSDGTLNAWAMLTTLFYFNDAVNQPTLLESGRFIALEEPENSLHPAALEILMVAIREVLPNVQVLLTTHSPELLEQINLKAGNEKVLVVESINGETIIDELDNASREVVQDEIFNLGELLKMDQLEPKSIAGKDRYLLEQGKWD